MYRTNLVWPLVHSYTWCAALGVYFGMPAATTAFYLTIMAWNALTHSDWRWDDTIIARLPGGHRLIRTMELVFITPRIHHTHHGYGNDGKVYHNFCTMLSFYDRLFGTLHVREGRVWRYGLPGGGEHHWMRQLLFPLVPLGEAKRRLVSRAARLSRVRIRPRRPPGEGTRGPSGFHIRPLSRFRADSVRRGAHWRWSNRAHGL